MAMKPSYEEWTRAEINRHRAEADMLQRNLDKWLAEKEDSPLNGSKSPPRSGRQAPPQARGGTKRGFVLRQIGNAGAPGASIDDLFAAVQDRFPKMKRSSLRALLYLESKSGNIIRLETGRYALKQEGPSASTSGPSHFTGAA
jgi:hypothetical protein